MARVQVNIYPYGDIGNRLVQVRKDLGLSQTQLADRLGIHWQTISRVETGQRKVDAEVLVCLCEMGYDATWLLTGKGDMLLTGQDHIEQQRLKAEYWETRHHLLETSVKVARHRIIDIVGREKADEVFKEIIQAQDEGAQQKPSKRAER